MNRGQDMLDCGAAIPLSGIGDVADRLHPGNLPLHTLDADRKWDVIEELR